MIYLAQPTWYPQIHRDIVTLAQKSRQCAKTGKNRKPIILKSKYVDLSSLSAPNEEDQMGYACPLPNNNRDTYIMAKIEKFSQYPHAETCNNCDTETARSYLKVYIKFHGIPRSVRCDQAQAYRANNFEVFCKGNNIKIILAPTGDHRGTGMVEKLIKTMKRWLAAIKMDKKWSKKTLVNKISAIIENIKLIINTTIKITPYTINPIHKQET